MKPKHISYLCFLLPFLTASLLADSIYDDLAEAKNPPKLYVFPGSGKISGWVAGEKNPDSQVVIKIGDKTERVSLDEKGFFTRELEPSDKNKITVTYRGKTETLSFPKNQKLGPVAFFVVDRSVYRPDSKIQFAAFLRKPDSSGKLVPVANQEVSVVITSVAKGIHAETLKLKSDDFGRITGQYKFTTADALDNYRLKVKEHAGEAIVKLAEFRKAKVRLEIDHKRTEPETMKLTFRALNYRDEPVNASTVKFDAVVIREENPQPGLWKLDPKKFAFAQNQKGTRYDLSKEKLALAESGQPVHWENYSVAVHRISKELKVGPDKEAKFFLTVDPGWKFNHVVQVQASLIDENDREQTASKRIPLSSPNHGKLKMNLSHREVNPGSAVDVAITTPSDHEVMLVTFRLKHENGNQMTGNYFGNQWGRIASYVPSVAREFLSVKPLRSTKEPGRFSARIPFAKPGAYLIQAVAHDAGENEIILEETVVVRPATRENGVFLELEKDRLSSGENLKGRVHSKFEGGEVLLALRDGNGVQKLRPIKVANGAADFELDLPGNLTLGCELSVRYTDAENRLHLHRRSFAVRDQDAEVKITSEVPKTVPPGEEVELKFAVDRKEITDLVVSVYDQSLLGIAPDEGVDGRSLFSADVRVEMNAAEDLIHAYLGDATPEELLKELDTWIEKNKLDANATPTERMTWQMYRNTRSRIRGNNLYEADILGILKFRGASILSQNLGRYYYNWYCQKKTKEKWDRPIRELINEPGRNGHTRLRFLVFGEHLVPQILFRGRNNAVWSQAGFGRFGNDNFVQIGHGGSAMHWGMSFGDISVDGGGMIDASGNLTGFSFASGNASWSAGAQIGHSHMPAPILQARPAAQLVGAHQASIPIRRDFSDSAFFNAKVRTGQDGKATVKFHLPDGLTHWQVVATAVTGDLAIGRHTASFQTHKPIMIWPMLSQGFTAGDRSKIFALVHNRTDKEQEFAVTATAKNGAFHNPETTKLTIEPNQSAPVYFDFEAGKAGFTEILMSVTGASGNDASLKRLPVFPCNSEQVVTRAGFTKGTVSLDIPEGVDLSRSRVEVTVSPSLAGDMLDSLDYLVSYPHGCVEQTMSRFLPTIKVTQILERYEIEDEQLAKTTPVYVKAGVKRLLELQKPDGGWGWQGRGATHEMMTPYALYGLVEAEQAGFEIPQQEAIKRGMQRLETFIKGMGDRQAADRIYCMWVYDQRNELKREWWNWLESITSRALGTERRRDDILSDYGAAMVMEMASKSGRKQLADRLAHLLEVRAQGRGTEAYWKTANFSRWGNDRFEITAAVLKAFAVHDPEHELVPRMLNFFAGTKRGKKWNSTKDTAMILYALCEYLNTQDRQSDEPRGKTLFSFNGAEHKVINDTWQPKMLVLSGEDIDLKSSNQIEFTGADPNHLYRIVFRYWKDGEQIEPVNEGVEVKRTFALVDREGKQLRELQSGDRVPRGSLIKSTVTASHGNNFTYTLAANPKPSCAEFTEVKGGDSASAHVLKEEKASGIFWHHENPGRALNNSTTYRVELAGKFLIPPAYVELMYDTKTRGSTGSFELIVGDAEKEVAAK